MDKKLFYIVFGLILIATLRFYYIEFNNGFEQLPVIIHKENSDEMIIQEN
jgi:hypothetical protein